MSKNGQINPTFIRNRIRASDIPYLHKVMDQNEYALRLLQQADAFEQQAQALRLQAQALRGAHDSYMLYLAEQYGVAPDQGHRIERDGTIILASDSRLVPAVAADPPDTDRDRDSQPVGRDE